MTQILSLFIGAALLLLGRELYWLFVAGIGFGVAVELVPRLIQSQSTLVILIVALATGIIGALLAVFLQKMGIGLGGFFAGGYVTLTLLDLAGMEHSLVFWILALVGAAVGVALTLTLFEWALIAFSSLIGAWMVTRTFALGPLITGLAFLILLLIGIAVQAVLMGRGRATRIDS